jgi:hypothetical protein
MASKGNGQHYQITFSGFMAQELKKLHKRAKAAGLGKAYVDALELAVFQMQHDPWEFGELIRRLKTPPLKIHVRIVKPLVIELLFMKKDLSC